MRNLKKLTKNSSVLSDIDIMVPEKEVVKPSVSRDFLIVHYHVYDNEKMAKRLDADRFYFVLAEPKVGIKVDIFDEANFPAVNPITVPFRGRLLKIRNVEDQLVVKAIEACRPLINVKTDLRHFETIALLSKIADMDLAEKYWRMKKVNPFPETLAVSLERTKDVIRIRPELVYDGAKKIRKAYRCPYCINLPDFPITPMEEAYKVLGCSTLLPILKT